MNYNNRLNELFARWMQSLTEEQQALFCKDGLIKNTEDVEEKWDKAERRVLFLLKDKNTPDGDDLRNWMNSEQCRNLTGGDIGRTGFLPNIAKMLYGLLKNEKEVRIGYQGLENLEEVKTVWNSEAFAMVESKKLAGYSSVSSSDVTAAMERDEAFLKEEIDILRPNIIVCCDAEDSQFNFITARYFKDKKVEKIEYDYPDVKKMKKCCLWYYPEDGVAVIKSYHPTRLCKDDWMIYERVISPFHQLLKQIDNL